ncbi:MAG: hypothetical protein M1411_02715 [Candidatus Thermoplasmatota archaeon]|jgi:hypothetical protein|nr:hypothetical protein [Candidatus Thermoplasmatota archaeon]
MKKIWIVGIALVMTAIMVAGISIAAMPNYVNSISGYGAHRGSVEVNNTSNGTGSYKVVIKTVAKIDGHRGVLADAHVIVYSINVTKFANGSVEIYLTVVFNGFSNYNGTIVLMLTSGHYLLVAHYHKLIDRKLVNVKHDSIVILPMHRIH